MNKAIIASKAVVIICMACLLLTTYMLRSQVLSLINSIIDGEDIVEVELMDRFEASEPDRKAAYEAALGRYEIQMKRYRELLNLYQKDPEAYARQTREGRPVGAPPVPFKPEPPQTPEVQQQLAETNAEFRQTRQRYFKNAKRLNMFVGLCAIGLIGGLLFLIMFDPEKSRLAYLVVLVVSFVFVIGPALHSVVSLMAYGLQPPPYSDSPMQYYDSYPGERY